MGREHGRGFAATHRRWERDWALSASSKQRGTPNLPLTWSLGGGIRPGYIAISDLRSHVQGCGRIIPRLPGLRSCSQPAVCYVRRRKRVEDDRAKAAEEEARLNDLRARSRAGKERQVRISERTLQEWQRTMDGRKIPIPQNKEEEEAEAILWKHNGLAPGKGCVASYFSAVPPSAPGSSPHPPCAGVTSGARALVQLHRRPW
jgi:hypothetical protein